MTRQSTFLLALWLLIVAGVVVSVAGWVLLARDRRARRTAVEPPTPDGTGPEATDETKGA